MLRKLLIASSLLVFLFTQSGFITGIVTLNPPLIAVGAVGTICCGAIGLGSGKSSNSGKTLSCDNNARCACVGSLWAGLCLALGKESDDSAPINLGPFPERSKAGKKFAESLGVQVQDVQKYNREHETLVQLHEVISDFLGKTMKSYSWNGTLDSLSEIEGKLSNDLELKKFALDFGFTDVAELIQIFKTNEISKEALQRFSRAVGIPWAVGKIFLQKAFLIKTLDDQAIPSSGQQK